MGGGGGYHSGVSWPAHTHYEENRLLLATEEESSERQSSDEDDALAVRGNPHD